MSLDKKEIYTYEAPWLIYGMNWSSRPSPKFRLAVGSFIEDYKNQVEVIQLDEDSGQFVSVGSFLHPYPTTKIMFIPDKQGSREDLIATTGDYLRIWRVNGRDDIKTACLLNNNKNSEFCIGAGTLVAMADGTSRVIENIKAGDRVLSRGLGGALPLPVEKAMSRGDKACVELLFSDGRTLVCTPEHRILQADGSWLRAEQMVAGASWVAATVEFPQQEQKVPESWRGIDLATSGVVNGAATAAQVLAFARVLGYLTTDGSVGDLEKDVKARIFIGHRLDLEALQADMLLLTGSKPKPKLEQRTVALQLPVSLHKAVLALGVTPGARLGVVTSVPLFLLDPACPVSVVREYLGGLFGSDGMTLAYAHGDGVFEGLGFCCVRAGSVARAQAKLWRTQLVPLLARCGVILGELEVTVLRKPPCTLTAASRKEYDALKAAGKPLSEHMRPDEELAPGTSYELLWRMPNSAVEAFAVGVGFRFACHKQMRLTAARAVFRANHLILEQKRAIARQVTERAAVVNMADAADAAKRDLADTASVHPKVMESVSKQADHLKLSVRSAAVPHKRAVVEWDLAKFFSQPRKRKLAPGASPAAAATAASSLSSGQSSELGAEMLQALERGGNEIVWGVPAGSPEYPCFKVGLVAVRDAGVRAVYDLSVPNERGEDYRSFTANGILVHNCAPLTSFDWNETDPAIIGTSSIDTTCTIWNVETHQAKTQLIAHDKEVYDLAFAPSTDVFASAGADGSVRMFDLRSLEHSTIIYESPELVPLLRLCWNKHDHNYLATFLMEQQQVVILDIRAPSVPVAELAGHSQCVNTLAWAPHSSCHICFGVDTRVLTSHGFKFVHEIETMLASGVNVEYACYDVSRRELVYGPGKLVLPTSTPKELVSFSHDSNHLELKVTAEHQVYCQVGTVGAAGHTQWPITSKAEGRKQISAVAGAGKVRAADLQSARRTAIRMVAAAENGVAGDDTAVASILEEHLGLKATQVLAFLELYGFWLGDGTLDCSMQVLRFEQKKPDDIAWLKTALPACGLIEGADYREKPRTSGTGTAVAFEVTKPAWFAFFDAEYGRKYKRSKYYVASTAPCDPKSAKWFWYWWRLLGRAQCRALLEGVQRADGDFAADNRRIWTSSMAFRDELVLLCLHAGYSAFFAVQHKAEQVKGYTQSSMQKTFTLSEVDEDDIAELGLTPIKATVDGWRVTYTSPGDTRNNQSCFPQITSDVVKFHEKYEGDRIWCVEVAHKDHLIMVQQVTARVNGVVTGAGRPVVTGNCTGGDDCQALIWDLAQMPKPITEPILAYNAEAEINTLQWSAAQPEWVAITFNKKLQILRV